MSFRFVALALLLFSAGIESARAQPVWQFNGVWTDNEFGDTIIVCYSPSCVPYDMVFYPGPVKILNGPSQYFATRLVAGLTYPYNATWNNRCTITTGQPTESVLPVWQCVNANAENPSERTITTTKAEPYPFPDGKIPEALSKLLEEIRRTPAPERPRRN